MDLELKDVSSKVNFSETEKIELKKDEIDYGLQAADLCAIDEADVEDSSKMSEAGNSEDHGFEVDAPNSPK